MDIFALLVMLACGYGVSQYVKARTLQDRCRAAQRDVMDLLIQRREVLVYVLRSLQNAPFLDVNQALAAIESLQKSEAAEDGVGRSEISVLLAQDKMVTAYFAQAESALAMPMTLGNAVDGKALGDSMAFLRQSAETVMVLLGVLELHVDGYHRVIRQIPCAWYGKKVGLTRWY